MAVTDAYVTPGEYRAHVTKSDTGDDTTILSQLTAVSRLIERQCGRFFTQDAGVVTRDPYNGNGLTRLYIDDVATLTGLVVKVDLNADYDFADSNETLTIGTHFWAGPANADKGAEPGPFRYLEIVPSNAVLTRWPNQLRAVQVTAKFGWPSVPGAIKEGVIAIVRQLRDMQEAGFTLTLQDIDASIRMSPESSLILRDIVRAYKLTSLFV